MYILCCSNDYIDDFKTDIKSLILGNIDDHFTIVLFKNLINMIKLKDEIIVYDKTKYNNSIYFDVQRPRYLYNKLIEYNMPKCLNYVYSNIEYSAYNTNHYTYLSSLYDFVMEQT